MRGDGEANLPVVIAAHSVARESVDVALGVVTVGASITRGIIGVVWAGVGAPTKRLVDFALDPPLIPPARSLRAVLRALSNSGAQTRAGALEIAALTARSLAVPATTTVVASVDVEAILDAVLDEIDLTSLVLRHVDLDLLVSGTLQVVDIEAIVREHVDVAAIADAALDQIDLTEIARSRVDLARLADEVIDEVHLPDLIRDSTSGVAASVVDEARFRAISADALVARWVDRVLLRGGRDHARAEPRVLDE